MPGMFGLGPFLQSQARSRQASVASASSEELVYDTYQAASRATQECRAIHSINTRRPAPGSHGQPETHQLSRREFRRREAQAEAKKLLLKTMKEQERRARSGSSPAKISREPPQVSRGTIERVSYPQMAGKWTAVSEIETVQIGRAVQRPKPVYRS